MRSPPTLVATLAVLALALLGQSAVRANVAEVGVLERITFCQPRSHERARLTCEALGLHLARGGLETAEDAMLSFYRTCNSPRWLQGATMNVWVDGVLGADGSWETAQGVPRNTLDLVTWQPLPNYEETNPQCALQNVDGVWRAGSCNEEHRFICDSPIPWQPHESQQAWRPCGDRTAQEAQEKCDELVLASPLLRSQHDHALASQAITSTCAPLSGGRLIQEYSKEKPDAYEWLEETRFLPVWIEGRYRDDDGVPTPGWYTNVGDPLPYEDWGPDQPNTANGTRRCVVLKMPPNTSNNSLEIGGVEIGTRTVKESLIPQMYAVECDGPVDEPMPSTLCFRYPRTEEVPNIVEVTNAQDAYHYLTSPGPMMLTVRYSATLIDFTNVVAIPIYGVRKLEGINRLASVVLNTEEHVIDFITEPHSELILNNIRMETMVVQTLGNVGRQYYTSFIFINCVFIDPSCNTASISNDWDLIDVSDLLLSLDFWAGLLGSEGVETYGVETNLHWTQTRVMLDRSGKIGFGNLAAEHNSVACSFEVIIPDSETAVAYGCQTTSDVGRSYAGLTSTSSSGRRCLDWSMADGLEGRLPLTPDAPVQGNYCRNPTSAAGGVWCFVAATDEDDVPLWEFCDVPICLATVNNPRPQPSSPGSGQADTASPPVSEESTPSGRSEDSSVVIYGVMSVLLLLIFICVAGMAYYIIIRRRRRAAPQLTIDKRDPTDCIVTPADLMHTHATTTRQNSKDGSQGLLLPDMPMTKRRADEDRKEGLLAHSLLNECTLLHPLGRGTFGSVWLGKWRGAEIAVKIISSTLSQLLGKTQQQVMHNGATDDIINTIESRATELFIGTRLQHPNIVRVFTHEIVLTVFDETRSTPPISQQGSMDGQSPKIGVGKIGSDTQTMGMVAVPQKVRLQDVKKLGLELSPRTIKAVEMVLVMEVCDLGDLSTNLRKLPLVTYDKQVNQCSINLSAMISVLKQIACAMMHLHSEGIVHADLKPANVLLQSNNTQVLGLVAKVADFGLSIVMGPEDTHRSTHRGTYRYMAPEVLLKNRLGKAADVWAFGAIMYESLCFTTPFKKTTMEQICQQYQSGECPYRNLPSTLPEWASQMIIDCTCLDPSGRPSFSEIYAIITTRIATNTLLVP